MPSWQEIVNEHGPAAYRAAWRILGQSQDCEDVLQDAFMEFYRFFAAGRIVQPKAFLFRIVTYRALDALRRREPHGEIDTSILLDDSIGPMEQVIELEEELRLRSIVAQLPARQAAVFCLSHFEEFTHVEIATALDITMNAVAMALHKARTKLRESMTIAIPENHQ